ncbi:MAG TPA: chromosome partitioning protein ParA [Deltaproteobacteria bacterium]|nr:chromosome partitioning protein ParA [Deltaproteobacteria bacterium]
MDGKNKEKGCSSKGCKDKAPDSAQKLRDITEDQALKNRLSLIKHKIMVLSGKGGVGKSTVAANVAVALAMEGRRVGILDIDFHGPSIPTLLNLEGRQIQHDGESLLPAELAEGVKVISLGFFLKDPSDAVIWRGPMKMNVIKQLLTEVKWGELDYLIMDFPPGTGDEPLSVAQLVPDSDGAIIVTTPQNLSTIDVRKSITFCRKLNVPVIGVIENMSGFVCPECRTVLDIFKTGGGEKMASEMGVPFLARIPIDPQVVEASDSGSPFVYHYSKTEVAKAFLKAVQPLLALEDVTVEKPSITKEKGMNTKRIAIPVTQGVLSSHFGHCEIFAIFDVDSENRVLGRNDVTPPPHEPGTFPAWLRQQGADIIIAGGMGSRAQGLFNESGIQVVVGAPTVDLEHVLEGYLNGTLETGGNLCDH